MSGIFLLCLISSLNFRARLSRRELSSGGLLLGGGLDGLWLVPLSVDGLYFLPLFLPLSLGSFHINTLLLTGCLLSGLNLSLVICPQTTLTSSWFLCFSGKYPSWSLDGRGRRFTTNSLSGASAERAVLEGQTHLELYFHLVSVECLLSAFSHLWNVESLIDSRGASTS